MAPAEVGDLPLMRRCAQAKCQEVAQRDPCRGIPVDRERSRVFCTSHDHGTRTVSRVDRCASIGSVNFCFGLGRDSAGSFVDFLFVWPKRRRRRNPVIGSFLVGFPAAVAKVNLFDCSSYRMLFITSQWESSHRNSVPSTPRYISISNNCNKDLVALFSFSECSVRIFDFMGGSSHQSWRIIRAGSVWAPLVV